MFCFQSQNMLLDWVETGLFTNEVMFDGMKFSFNLIQEAQLNITY
jgi:hypothetical protein